MICSVNYISCLGLQIVWYWSATVTYCIHINAIGIGPSMLEILLQPLPQAWRYLVETDELFDPQQLCVVACGSRVETLYDCWDIPKYAGIHEGWKIGKLSNLDIKVNIWNYRSQGIFIIL